MDRAIYTAMSAATQTMKAQTVHANNLANVNTNGFQRDFVTAQSRYVEADGTLNSRATSTAISMETDFSVGALQETGRDLDLAIAGKGFIAVVAKDGSEAYTRAGSLQIDSLGRLLNDQGLQVLGSGGPIVVPPSAKTEIGKDGTISIRPLGQGGEALATVERIKLVRGEPAEMHKRKDGLMEARSGALLEADPGVRVQSGYLEASNVNAVESMTEILALSRQFEMQVKMMNTVDKNTETASTLLR
jgi:flagellar basal-body rod protein FlgF